MAADAPLNVRERYAGWVLPLCWTAILLDGFDLVVLGAVLPTLLDYGAVLTALLGVVVLGPLGWRAMFVIGALPALVLVPLMLRHLPESDAFLHARAATGGGAEAVEKRAYALRFPSGLGRSTVAFWVTSFTGLLLVYGLNTWLPQIMREAGHDLGAALALLLALSIGAVLGLLVAGRVADQVGSRPAAARATALGAVAGVGRGIAYPWGFYVFAAVGALGALAFSTVGVRPVVDVVEETTAPVAAGRRI